MKIKPYKNKTNIHVHLKKKGGTHIFAQEDVICTFSHSRILCDKKYPQTKKIKNYSLMMCFIVLEKSTFVLKFPSPPSTRAFVSITRLCYFFVFCCFALSLSV